MCYCVLALFCAVLGVCFSLGSFAGGVDVSCGTAMLNIFSAAVWFSTSCGMGMDGGGWGWVLECLCEIFCHMCHHILWGQAW